MSAANEAARRDSVIADTALVVDPIRDLLAHFGHVDRSRIEVETSGSWPTVTLDLKLDGERAPQAWWDLVGDTLRAAEALNAYKSFLERDLEARREERRRFSAMPWWRRLYASVTGKNPYLSE